MPFKRFAPRSKRPRSRRNRQKFLRVAANTVDLDADAARSVLKLMEELEDHDDVQSATANFNIPDSVMAELEASA